LLTGEGYRTSVFSRAVGLWQVIEGLKPDIVLIDVLMPDLNRRLLTELLAGSRKKHRPPMILHSRLSERILRTVTDTSDAAGIIQKTSSALEFLLAFNTIADRVAPDSRRMNPTAVSMSGTHRIGSDRDFPEDEHTLRTGSTR
jgi:DNA-binding NarL/FixJ family response regulator